MEEDSKKPEISEKTKRKKAKIAVISLATIIVILLGLQVYASTNGYGNMFFMIKEWVTGNVSGKDNLLSDKDITLSYKSIDLTDNLKIQANRIEIKDGKTKIYLTVKPLSEENVPLKYTVYTNINNKKEIEGIKPQTISDYQEVLELDYEVREDDLITMEIRNKDNKELKTLEINLKTREIIIKGENDIEKISEIELRKYLDLFSELNNGANKADVLLYITQSMYNNYEIFIGKENFETAKRIYTDRGLKNAIIKEFYGDKAEFEYKNQVDTNKPKVEVLKGIVGWEFDIKNDSYKPLTAGEEYRHGKCLKIEDISYESGIYTIKYVYVLYTAYDEDDEKLEELPQYETTIKLKRDNNQLFSKYKILSLDEAKEISERVTSDVSETTNNTNATNTATNTNITNTIQNNTNENKKEISQIRNELTAYLTNVNNKVIQDKIKDFRINFNKTENKKENVKYIDKVKLSKVCGIIVKAKDYESLSYTEICNYNGTYINNAEKRYSIMFMYNNHQTQIVTSSYDTKTLTFLRYDEDKKDIITYKLKFDENVLDLFEELYNES